MAGPDELAGEPVHGIQAVAGQLSRSCRTTYRQQRLKMKAQMRTRVEGTTPGVRRCIFIGLRMSSYCVQVKFFAALVPAAIALPCGLYRKRKPTSRGIRANPKLKHA